MSRTKAYRERQRAKGLCIACPTPRVSATYCASCLIKARVHSRTSNNTQPHRPGGRGRTPLVPES